MTRRRKGPKQEPSPQSPPKRRVDALTVITLVAVAAALAISVAARQQVRRLEERLDAQLSRIEAPRTPGASEQPPVAESAVPPYSPVDEPPISLDVDAASLPLVGVQPVGSRQPDYDRVYSIRTDSAPTRGRADAPVTLVEFSDFQCSFCRKAKPTVARVLEVYGDQVRLVWKHLPLAMHREAPEAHMASVAAANQGSFWEFHRKLFDNPDALQPDDLRQYALEVGLSMQRFEEDLLDPRTRSIVEADMEEAVSMDLTATPGYFVNGRYLRGAKPFEDFASLINAELEKLGLSVPPAARIDEAAATSPAS